MNTNIQAAKSLEDLPDFFSAAQLSEVLGLSKATTDRRVEEGKIPCLRIGRRLIISRAHLLRWLDQELTEASGYGKA